MQSAPNKEICPRCLGDLTVEPDRTSASCEACEYKWDSRQLRSASAFGEIMAEWGFYRARVRAQGDRRLHAFIVSASLEWIALAMLGGLVGNATYDGVKLAIRKLFRTRRMPRNMDPTVIAFYLSAHAFRATQWEIESERLKRFCKQFVRIGIPPAPVGKQLGPANVPPLLPTVSEVADWFEATSKLLHQKLPKQQSHIRFACESEFEILYADHLAWADSAETIQREGRLIERINRDIATLEVEARSLERQSEKTTFKAFAISYSHSGSSC